MESKKTPYRPPFLQDFCKKAQWRAKKLRERGSNTARPTEKGGGGLQIGARPADFGAISACWSCRFRRVGRADFGVLVASCRFRRAGRVLPISARFRRAGRVLPISSRFRRAGRVLPISSRFGVLVASCRFRRDLACWSCRHPADNRAKTQKKPDSSIGGSGSTVARRRALLTFG